MTKYIRRGMTDFSYKSFSREIGKKNMKELLGMELGLILDLTKYPQNISEEGAKRIFRSECYSV